MVTPRRLDAFQGIQASADRRKTGQQHETSTLILQKIVPTSSGILGRIGITMEMTVILLFHQPSWI
jgi:hypothetical protein